jgi:hypothetical protein
VRPSGDNTNGGGFDTGISGHGTDYSQQDAAQLSLTDLACTTGTSTLTSATGGFTSAMIGNAVQISSGTNFTAGEYFIIAYASSNSVTLDRTPVGVSSGSAGHGKIGGAWADFWTNVGYTNSYTVPGNTIYVLGSGIPDPSVYGAGAPTAPVTYDYLCPIYRSSMSSGSTSANLFFLADPATPDYASGGMPLIYVSQVSMFGSGISDWYMSRFWFVAGGIGNNSSAMMACSLATFVDCVYDAFGYDCGFLSGGNAVNCDFFSSQTARTTNTNGYAISVGTSAIVTGCHIHGFPGNGIQLNGGVTTGNLITGCGGYGLVSSGSTRGGYTLAASNNTVDACAKGGLHITSAGGLQYLTLVNNIFSNHSPYAIDASGAGSSSTNALLRQFIDYNVFYNNSSDYNALAYGAHDVSNNGSAPTVNSADPYTNHATGDLTLTSTYVDTGFPQTAFPNH